MIMSHVRGRVRGNVRETQGERESEALGVGGRAVRALIAKENTINTG